MMQRSYACRGTYERPTCGCSERPPCGCPERPAPPPCSCGECQPCSCGPRPCLPQKPLPAGGFLLPRIIAAGREWQRRCSLSLAVDGLPVDAEPPLTLLEVTPCGQPSWETLDCCDPRMTVLRVKVPLTAQVRDRCNRLYAGRAAITVDIRLRHAGPRAECWRSNLLVLPCVRLICVPCSAETPCFDVLLEVLVEAYMARWEPCLSGPAKPVCPDLPLFPQPCFQ